MKGRLAALVGPTQVEIQEYPLGGELPMLRERASIIALDMLRKYLQSMEIPGA